MGRVYHCAALQYVARAEDGRLGLTGILLIDISMQSFDSVYTRVHTAVHVVSFVQSNVFCTNVRFGTNSWPLRHHVKADGFLVDVVCSVWIVAISVSRFRLINLLSKFQRR